MRGTKLVFWILYFCLEFQNFGPFFLRIYQKLVKMLKIWEVEAKIQNPKTSFVPLIKPNSHAKNHGN